jgi:hypothetical protein
VSEVKQKRKYCRECKRKTLHVATFEKQNLGCGFVVGNLFLCVITLGLWLPIFILMLGLGTFSNALAPFGAKYHCQVCGRVN